MNELMKERKTFSAVNSIRVKCLNQSNKAGKVSQNIFNSTNIDEEDFDMGKVNHSTSLLDGKPSAFKRKKNNATNFHRNRRRFVKYIYLLIKIRFILTS